MEYLTYNPSTPSENSPETSEAIEALKSGTSFPISELSAEIPKGTVFSIAVADEIRHIGLSASSRGQIGRIGLPLNPATEVNERTKAHVARKWALQIAKRSTTYHGANLPAVAEWFQNPRFVELFKSLQRLIAASAIVRFVQVDDYTHRKLLQAWAEKHLGCSYNKPR